MVRIARFGKEHLEATQRWLASPTLRAEIDCLKAPTQAENEACWQRRWKDPSREDYAIIDDQDGHDIHVGNCGLSDLDLKRSRAQLWIYIAEQQGRGIGGAVMRLLLKRTFEDLKLEKLYLRVPVSNARANEFYRWLGFVEEGRLRHDMISSDGFVDSFLLSMLSHEFKLAPL